MTPVSLEEYLNKRTLCVKRLLGLTDFHKERDIFSVENEYDQKYAELLQYDLNTVREYSLLECKQAGIMHVSIGLNIYEVSVEEAYKLYCDSVRSRLNKYLSANICELGCGYGFIMSLFGKNAYGGDYSRNAVSLGRRLGLDISRFNYYDETSYDFIRPDSTIFTAHSVEQIPDAKIIVSGLAKQRDKINYVVHFEPMFIEDRSSLIGLLRNKYVELNDYNRNLVGVLKSRGDVEILEFHMDEFSFNPLNSTNFIAWRFK